MTPDRLKTMISSIFISILWITTAAAFEYPDLRDCHSPELQAMLDRAMLDRAMQERTARNRKGTTGAMRTGQTDPHRQMGAVVADITDLKAPKVAWYKPETMYYAASLPKIAIVLGVLTQVDQGRLTLGPAMENKLVGMIRHSSNPYATELLRLVGIKQLADILRDPKYGALYDPEYGGGLWVGRAYGKGGVRIGDPLNNISHGASAMQAARFYYGAITGTIIKAKYRPLLAKIFGDPAINHKFVKGLAGREDVEIYRKSGTWRDYHADSGVVVHEDYTYIVVYIEHHPDAGNKAVKGIRIVDDVMKAYTLHKKS
jgi:beta-lactamase class A